MENEKKSQNPEHRKASLGLALGVIAVMIAIMVVGVMVLKTISIPACLIVIIAFICTVSKFALGYSFNEMMGFIADSLKNGAFGLWFFIAIGAIIATWMASGTVPAVIYYGLQMISPKVFLPAGLILCSLMSLSTGSSWATVGTVGIALVGIGQGMGIPLPLTAAMIVSGASFGDKLSPVSDTPNLIAVSTGSELYSIIKSMIVTITPAYIITFVLFTLLGLKYGNTAMNYSIIRETRSILAQNFNMNPIVLLPIIVLLILSIKKFPSLPSMAIATVIGILIAVIFQKQNLANCIEYLNAGFSIKTGSKYVDPILNRGGLQNMLWTFSVAFLAISMGGLLDRCGYLSVMVDGAMKRVRTVGSLSLIVLITSALSTAFIGEAYLSFILNGTLYKKEFDKKGLDRAMLGRLISDGGYMPAPLLPWTTFGAFCMATLGISGLQYAPFTFLNLITPVVSVVFSYIGIGVLWNNPVNKGKRKFSTVDLSNEPELD